jgi:hypothetical protein
MANINYNEYYGIGPGIALHIDERKVHRERPPAAAKMVQRMERAESELPHHNQTKTLGE